jgi:hypothetical protein
VLVRPNPPLPQLDPTTDHQQDLSQTGGGHCLVCRKPLQRSSTGRTKKFCSDRHRKAWNRLRASFVPPTHSRVSECRETPKILQRFQQGGAVIKGIDRRPMTDAEKAAVRLFCDGVDKEALARANRLNAQYWREHFGVEQAWIEGQRLAATAEQKEIEANGYFTEPEWREFESPDACKRYHGKSYVTRFRQTTGPIKPVESIKQPVAKITIDWGDLAIPDFLKRPPTEPAS